MTVSALGIPPESSVIEDVERFRLVGESRHVDEDGPDEGEVAYVWMVRVRPGAVDGLDRVHRDDEIIAAIREVDSNIEPYGHICHRHVGDCCGHLGCSPPTVMACGGAIRGFGSRFAVRQHWSRDV